jgi:hypothetical protein
MRHNVQNLFLAFAALLSAGLSTGCEKTDGLSGSDSLSLDERSYNTLSGYVPNTPLVALTSGNELASLVSGPPALELSRVPITGVRPDEIILAIDTRPKTREVFGISDQSVLYRLDPATGAATAVSGAPLEPAVNGKLVSFDVNPVDDLIRLTTEGGQNLRVSPVTGAVVGVDVPINFNQTALGCSAYSYALGASRSMFFGISHGDGTLYRSTNPNGGVIQYVGNTGFEFIGDGGFEITNANTAFVVQNCRGKGGTALGAIDGNAPEAYRLLLVNLKTGRASSLGVVKDYIGLAQRG